MSATILNKRYKLIRPIEETTLFTVYEAFDEEDNREVDAYILKMDLISNRIEDNIRFKRVIQELSNLKNSNIQHDIEFELQGDKFIITDHQEYQGLNLILENTSFSERELLKIGLEISKILERAHNIGVIHGYINPESIMVLKNENGYNVRLRNFEISRLIEFDRIKDGEGIQNTFGYISPEKSGIIKIVPDERSDLYSLGILLYRLATGVLPFTADDIFTILHYHIAKLPKNPKDINNEIQEITERIILKLLEKEPEKRYQSAKGLAADLEMILSGERFFETGKNDKSAKLVFKTKNIGRDKEFQILRDSFDSTLTGKGNVCFIGGEAGMGKSRLCEELKEYIYRRNGIFVSGKFFSGENKTPYAPFKEALDTYFLFFEKFPLEKKRKIIEKLKEAVGGLGSIVVGFDNRMRDIIGGYPELVRLEPERESERFYRAIITFFIKLAELSDGLCILLDDIQWIDESSMMLISKLIESIEDSQIMIVATYRNNELSESIKNLLIDSSIKKKKMIKNLKVEPLSLEEIDKLVSGMLYENSEVVNKISEIVFNKSKGNPFFAIGILKQFVEEKAILKIKEKWMISEEILNRIEIPLTLVDLVLNRIKLLKPRDIEVISYAAFIGRKFNLSFLFELIDNIEENEIIDIIDRAISYQLLEKDIHENDKILFVHDRIREAFYKNIGDENKKVLHKKIAKSFEEITEKNIETVFDIAYHYLEAEESDKIVEYAYPAAVASIESYANENAVFYFKTIINILDKNGKKGTELWLKCAINCGEVYIKIGKYDATIEISLLCLDYITDRMERARIFKQIAHAYFKKSDWEKCEDYGRKGLKLLGESIPKNRGDLLGSILYEFIKNGIRELIFKNSFNKTKSDEKSRLILQIYYIFSWMYYLTDALKTVRTGFRMVNIARKRLGKSKESATSLSILACVYMALPFFKIAEKYHMKSLMMREELDDEWGKAQSYQAIGYYYAWKGDYEKSIKSSLKSIELNNKIGDISELGISNQALFFGYYYIGNYSKANEANETFYKLAEKSGDYYGLTSGMVNKILTYSEIGDFTIAKREGLEGHEMAYQTKNDYVNCVSAAYLGNMYIENEEYDKAEKYLEKAKKMNEANMFIPQFNVELYPALAEVKLKLILDAKGILEGADQKIVEKLCKIALKKCYKWRTHYSAALRVTAKYYSIVGYKNRARQYFIQSMHLAEKLGRKYELAKSIYEYGLFLKEIGKEKEAKIKLESSYSIFKEIGARSYVEKLSQILDIKNEESSIKKLINKQRLYSIIKISQDISSILDLGELLQKVIETTVGIIGAQRGILISMDKNNRLNILAKKCVSDETLLIPEAIVKKVYSTEEMIMTKNLQDDPKLKEISDKSFEGIQSMLCMPILYKKSIKGVCYLDNNLASGLFQEEDGEILHVFLSQAAIAIENAEMYKEIEALNQNLEKKVEERTNELRQAQTEIISQEKMASVGKLACGLAHELNSPLGAALTSVELIKLDLEDFKEQKIRESVEESVEIIGSAINKSREIISKLLTYGSMGKGTREKLGVRELSDIIKWRFKKEFETIGIEYEEDIDEDSVINVNKIEIVKAISNIAENSIYALKNINRQKRYLRFKSYFEKNIVYIEIKDNGTGISEENIGKIFDPFFTTKDVGEGMGLGLTVSYETIVNGHNGEIKIDSKYGEYTCVVIKFHVRNKSIGEIV